MVLSSVQSRRWIMLKCKCRILGDSNTFIGGDDCDNDAFRSKVKAFAEKNGLKMVDVFEIAYSPIDFLNAIKFASVVFAASFHATLNSAAF